MSTRLSARNLFPPLDNPELTIQRRSRADPTLLNDFEMAAKGNGDPPVLDLRTMEELCQPSLNGRGGPIAPIAIQATNFELKNDMIQQVQNSFQFHGLPGDDANKHLDKFLHVTQSIKVNEVTDDALRGTFMKRHLEECYDLIENMTAHHNDWDTLAQRSESSSSITSSSNPKIIALKAKMAKINKNLMRVLQVNQQVKAVTPNYETYGGPHSYNDCPAIVGQTQNVYAAGAHQGGNSYQPQGNSNLLSYRLDNYLGPPGFNQNQNRNNQNQNFQNQNKNHGIPQGNNQGRNQFFQGASHGQNPPPAYQAPAYQAPASRENSSKTDDRIDKLTDQISTLVDIVSKKVVTPTTVKAVKKFCVTCGGDHAYYNSDATNSNQSSVCAATSTYNQVIPQNRASNHMAPPGFAPLQNSQNKYNQNQNQGNNFNRGNNFHVVPIPEPNVPKTLPKPNIPYPSRLNDQKLHEKATNQMDNFFQNFQDLHFDIRFADALLLMPKFASTIKSLLANKDKLFELAKIPLNENCSAMLLKKLPKKLGDLVDRSITCPKGVAEDVFVKVGKFHFPIDFVVFDFEADPRVPLILGRSFLRTDRALIDVYGDEITLRVNDKAGSDFILEEIEAYLKDDLVSPEINHADCDPEGDICLIEKLLNNDPFQLPLIDLKQEEVAKVKSSINEPLELELKELSSHLEYAYLEGTDKLPVIIAKGLKDDEKEGLLKVLKSHKWAIALKITDTKGIDPHFCTHKILMEEDYKPTVKVKDGLTRKFMRMPFGLCNAPGTFHRCMMAIFHDMIEKTMEVFMDDFSVFGDSFSSCLSHLDTMLQRCKDTNLVLN
nr:hypothetical protein [Tanacetum cinerariifolium]